MTYEHDYYSDQCAGCKWAEWRGGCLNKATADDGSDLDAADRGECKHFEAGQPQRRPPQPNDRVYVHIPLAEYDALRARAEAAEAKIAHLRAELAQTRADRVLLAGMWLVTVPPNVVAALLPADQGDRDRLATMLDAVGVRHNADARTIAACAVIERIVEDVKGGV